MSTSVQKGYAKPLAVNWLTNNMATVINTPGTTNTDTGAGWAVALVVLAAAVIIGLFIWPGYVRNSAAPASPGTNINVTVPEAPAGGAASTPATDSGGAGGTVTP